MVLAAGVTLILGLVAPFTVGFGLLTDCTNQFDCTEVDTVCGPCAAVETWLYRLRDGELGLLVAVAVLAGAGLARRARAVVGVTAWVVIGLALSWLVFTIGKAGVSF